MAFIGFLLFVAFSYLFTGDTLDHGGVAVGVALFITDVATISLTLLNY